MTHVGIVKSKLLFYSNNLCKSDSAVCLVLVLDTDMKISVQDTKYLLV